MRTSVGFACLLLPLWAAAATPPEGVALKVRRGFFTETDIGGFMTVGGDNAYSNLQTYLQLGLGYDVSESIELGLHVGIGSNAANCWSGLNAKEECIETDNFTMMFLDVTAAYLVKIGERLYLTPKLAGGYTLLEPAPVYEPRRQPGAGGKLVPEDATPINKGPNAGIGVGIEYATSMDHFSVGFDILARYILGPNIPSLQFFPRVKYTF